MPGYLDGVSMMAQALRAFQRGIDTAGHNLANVNTPGYSRQRVNLSTTEAMRFYEGDWRFQGQGVNLVSISRARDLVLEGRWRGQLGQFVRAETSANGLNRVAGVYAEPGENGISHAFTRFFDAWSGFGANPNDQAARLDVRQQGANLASRIRGAWFALEGEANQAIGDVQNTIARINTLAEQISDLNSRVQASSLDKSNPNDLLDQRDAAVRELSQLVNVSVSQNPGGAYVVHASGFLLVTDFGARSFPSTFDASTGTVSDNGVSYTVREGGLAGHMQTLRTARTQQSQLDVLANELREAVNTIHRTGTNFKEVTDIDFFNPRSTDPLVPTGAFDLALSDLLQESADYAVAGISGKPGDGALAHEIAGLRQVALLALNGRTLSAFYGELAHGVAADAAAYQQSADIASAVLDQTIQQSEAASGVNLDDEMAQLIQYQRSFQAAAKVLSIMDEVAQDLIGMLRR